MRVWVGPFIAILAQFCMGIPQFNPNLIFEKLDLTDTVKRDLDFLLNTTAGYFGQACLIPIGNQRWTFVLIYCSPFWYIQLIPKRVPIKLSFNQSNGDQTDMFKLILLRP